MDTIKKLYLSTDGRLSRKQFWLGFLGLLALSIVLNLLSTPLGYSLAGGIPALDPGADPAAIAVAMGEVMRRGAWLGLVLFLILAYPLYCLCVKRRHDRDSAGRDVLLALALNVVILLIQAFGLGLTTIEANGTAMPAPSMLFMIVSGITGLLGLYLLIVLGFLRGTPGSNSYGPDPVLGAAATV